MSRDPALDEFPRLSHSSSKIRLEAAGVLLEYFIRLHDKEENTDEVTTVGRRLARGLGCSSDAARRGYYLTFTGFLKVFADLPYSSVVALAEKELKVSTASSKGEEGDLWSGRVLFFGSFIRSGHYQKSARDEQIEVVGGLMEAAFKRSYLPALAAPFVIHLLQLSTEDQFSKVLWPVLEPHLAKEWTQQTQHTLYMLLHITQKFKVKKTELKTLLGIPLLGQQNWPHVARLVLEGPHPLISLVAKSLPPSDVADFWTGSIQESLEKFSRARSLSALNLLQGLFATANNKTLASLVTKSTVTLLKTSLQDKELRLEAGDAMEALVTKTKAAPDSVRAKVLESLTAEEFSFDQVTKCGLVNAITGSLEAEGVKLTMELCKKVVLDDQKKNKVKLGAMQMMASLAVRPNIDVNLRQSVTIFLLEQAFFSKNAAGVFCKGAKTNFSRCLKNAPDSVLKAIVEYVDKQLKSNNKPLKMENPAAAAWKKMATHVAKLEAVKGKVESVLSLLMSHVGLQLLTDPVSAIEALEELFECSNRVMGGDQDKHWAEIVVELLLSLLAHPSAALRVTVKKVFTALCPMMTQQALGSLVEACSAQDDPLVPKDQADLDDEMESEDENEEEAEDEEEESEAEEDESEEEEEEDDEMEDFDGEDTAADKIRAAVRSALGPGGEMSDTESIDVDDISEEEGRRIDEALSQAFKGARKSLSKKQSLEQQQMVHFRLRVLDLLEAYVSSEHSLRLTLDLAGPLLSLLERCLRDEALRPLEGRLRNIITRFGQLRKFADTNDVTETDLVECLSALLDHGQRTQAVFLAVATEAATIVAFLGRAAQSIEPAEALTSALIDAMKEFFCKRDCILPSAFFGPLLKTAFPGNLKLWPVLTEIAFGDDENVRPFRRPQALNFLVDLANNQHLRTTHAKEVAKWMDSMASGAAASLASPELKQRFQRQLLIMLSQLVNKLNEKQKNVITKELLKLKMIAASKEAKKAVRKLELTLKFKIPVEAKPDKTDEDGEVVVNGNAVVNGKKGKKTLSKRKKKKEKKLAKKRSRNQELAAKKASKRMRLEVASQGMETVGFSNIRLNNSHE